MVLICACGEATCDEWASQFSMGVSDGKIKAWRDYFDIKEFKTRMG